MGDSRTGAYGLALVPPHGPPEWWVEAPPQWESWRIEWQVSHAPAPEEWLDRDTAGIHLAPTGFALIDRASSCTHLHLPADPGSVPIVHPYLVSTAIAAATWAGDEAFHAAGFEFGGGIWGILGDRGMGKSTAVAWLHQRGVPVFCDDLLVIRGPSALAGPRSLDLREESARRFGLGDDIGVVGTRRRWRVRLGPTSAERPFAGWVVLRWRQGPASVEPVPATVRFEHLLDGRALLLEPENPANWLELVAKPMVVLSRQPAWDGLDRSMNLLLDELSRLS